MPINFGNVGISGIVCTNASSILADISGVAITNSLGQLVGTISLPRNFTKLKSEGSRIVGFNITGIRDDLLVPFTKSTSGEDLTFNRSDIIDFVSYEPDGLLIESNEYSKDFDSNEPINFKFYYPFNQDKFAPDRTLIASNISSLLYFLQQQEADPSSKIQNAFNFNINDFISPSGDDISVASGSVTQAIEVSKRISVLVQATTSSVQGVSELDCFQALAANVASETTARSGVQTFFEEKSSGIILSTIASASGLASIDELPQEIINQTINLADNINDISNKDIENYDRGNQISSFVLVQNILQQGIDLKDSNTTITSTINQQVETIASGILGANYTAAPTTTTTTAAPTTTTTTTSAPTPSWDPSYLGSSLFVWLDSSDANTIILNGSNVSQWRDKSGNNRHVSQAIAERQPTYQTNNLNGLAGVINSGSPRRLESADNISWNFDVGSFAAVCSFGAVNEYEMLFQVDGRQSITSQFFFFRRNVLSAFGDPFRTTPINSGATVYAGRYNRSVATNGSANGTNYNHTAVSTFTGSSTISRLVVLGTSHVFVGAANEIVLFNSYISDVNREKLEGYLAHKWGLTNNLPNNHPYKNNPPTS